MTIEYFFLNLYYYFQYVVAYVNVYSSLLTQLNFLFNPHAMLYFLDGLKMRIIKRFKGFFFFQFTLQIMKGVKG